MKTFARIEGGKVREILVASQLPQFHPSLEWHDASNVADVAEGWTFANGIFSAPPSPSLESLKAGKNDEINSSRLVANKTTFTHAGLVIACDLLSRGDIDAVANHISLYGTFPPGFPGGWKAIDNTIIPMPSIDAFKAFYQSMTAQGTTNFNKAQALKATLAQAETKAEIDAITW